MATIKCNDTNFLINVIKQKHPTATELHPTANQHQFTFSCGLIMNIYTTGTVMFQGNSYENRTASDILAVIDMINRPVVPV
ncbi:hypothetical protein DMX02_14910 [Pseudomonas jessenii]|jgi:hypothetical protein|nr:hypothetical protein DMX02_14910 [Pseudomonas jessenii]